MSDYKKVFRRLAAYRKGRGITQERVAEKIHISQEQYSYLENGISKMTDKDLRGFLELGWNIDYIITGEETFYGSENKVEEAFAGFKDEEGKEFAMKLCAEVMIIKAVRGRLWENHGGLKEKLELLSDMVDSWQDFSMCHHVRKRLKISQLVMAEKLGLGIKKYREIEREIKYPDAEMLLTLYDMSGYPPMLFLDFYDWRLLLLKLVWDVFGDKDKEEILDFIYYMKKIL